MGETKKTILVCSVSLACLDPYAGASHNQMWYRMGRYAERHNITFIFYAPRRESIDGARNKAARMAINARADAVFYYDDDMITDPNTFIRLYEKMMEFDLDIIQAGCVIRGAPFDVMFFKQVNREEKLKEIREHNPNDKIELSEDAEFLAYYNDYAKDIDENGLVEVAAVGNATTLYRTDLFKKVSEPWFKSTRGSTEDVFFCCKARTELKKTVKMYVDVTLDTGHLCDKYVVSLANKDDLKKIHKLYPEIL